MIMKIINWVKKGSNLIDLLMLVGLLIIISTTFYVNSIIGFYLLGILLIVIPLTYYKLTRK
ncbi:hypothetical protein [Clostridium tertium]|uniref:hypothetical protein n=1 Tax=Clostridium tertium TaxID=1559 RepID=UPI0034A286E8